MGSKCGKRCEVYTRVSGFFTPLYRWNPGKLAEYEDRKEYDIGKLDSGVVDADVGLCSSEDSRDSAD